MIFKWMVSAIKIIKCKTSVWLSKHNKLRKRESYNCHGCIISASNSNSIMYIIIVFKCYEIINQCNVMYGITWSVLIIVFSVVTFEEGYRTKILEFRIKDDEEAELLERVSFQITSVHLVNLTLDPLLGMPPSIDEERSFVNLTIKENDFPYGVIGFQQPVIIFHEWEGNVRIPVLRRGIPCCYIILCSTLDSTLFFLWKFRHFAHFRQNSFTFLKNSRARLTKSLFMTCRHHHQEERISQRAVLFHWCRPSKSTCQRTARCRCSTQPNT